MSTRMVKQRKPVVEDTRISSLLTLEQRLDDGYRRIENGQRLGADVTQWEDFWLDLLHQYEQLADRVDGGSSWDLAA